MAHTIRVGQGYDIHRLVPNRKLILAGTEIPCVRGLLGHSDGDVVLHAVIDALLGAAGLGDIGELFPDTDPTFKDADSAKLLERALELVTRKGFTVGNVDLSIIVEKPKLKAYKPAMTHKLADLLGVGPDCINIKAKTNERCDAAGQGEAVVCYVSVLLIGDSPAQRSK